MPPFDREGALKSAEKALRQGRIDAAIVEYVKVVEAQPRDWNSANALGDLYVRANQLDKGLQQFTRIVVTLDGFLFQTAIHHGQCFRRCCVGAGRPGSAGDTLLLDPLAAALPSFDGLSGPCRRNGTWFTALRSLDTVWRSAPAKPAKS